MSFEVTYVSAACNQTPNTTHWGNNGLICYASQNAILIYDPQIGGGKVIDTLQAHKKHVNGVRWISGCEYETELVSASSDNDVIVWTLKNGEYFPAVLKGHTKVVSLVDALYKDVTNRSVVVASAAIDLSIKIWTRSNADAEFVLHQDIKSSYSMCIRLRLMLLPQDGRLMMAAATDESNITIYTEEDGNQLVQRTVLKGHEDWVQGLDFNTDDNNNILLASSSQDAFIRVWKFALQENTESPLDVENEFETLGLRFRITVLSVIMGHESWVYSANWSRDGLKLVSASMDKSIIIWEFDPDADMWLESVRLGEVGGNTLGFFEAMFSPDGNALIGYGYHGAFHLWRLNEEMGEWEPEVTVGGHFSDVIDLCWEPFGEYVMSVSSDQTTRVHAPWECSRDGQMTWHEIARPQVHGYGMHCLAIVNRYKIASGAEEKIIRTFQASANFVQNFRRICRIEDDDFKYDAPKGASVPSLGLSNKAIYANDNIEQATVKSSRNIYPEESHFTAVDLTEPPTEETLLQNTLWPEIHKLYGHGYELYSLAASPDGKLLASTCKATTPEHAALIIWETENWQIIQKLQSHTLTVVQIAFSPDNNHILSVSRDRRWSLFSRNVETSAFELTATTNKATGIHSRIIWTCAWSHDSKYFATGSRDGKVVVWCKNKEKEKQNVLGQYEAASSVLSLKNESVTALAFAPNFVGDNYLVAVGLETGTIHLFKWSTNGFVEVFVISNRYAHQLLVKKLAFRPQFGRTGHRSGDSHMLQLASCSSDRSLRIYDIDTNTL